MMKRGRQAIARLLALMMVLPAGAVPAAMTTPRSSANVLSRPLPLDAVLRGRPSPRIQYTTNPATQSGAKTIASRVQAPKLGAGGGGFGPCATPANGIVAENCLPGSPQSEWDLDPQGLGGL